VGAIKPIAVKSTSPADGAVLAPASRNTLVLKTDENAGGMSVEVATQPTLGQDGTLATEYTVDYPSALQGDAFPDTYTATAFGFWSQYPGTYYWQMHFNRIDYVPDPSGSPYPWPELNDYVSPVFKLVVAAPAPPPRVPTAPRVTMSKAQALSYLRPALRKITRHSVFRLRRECDRVDSEAFNCVVKWWTSRRGIRGKYYTGEIDLRDVGTRIRYTFDGRKATAKCIKRRSIKRCLRPVR
jgi:hypothetical protein